MSNNEWVQEGTPRDADTWSEDQDDYGVPVEPWDDYSSEQGVPVPKPVTQEQGREADEADAHGPEEEAQATPSPEPSDPFARPDPAQDEPVAPTSEPEHPSDPVVLAPTAPEQEEGEAEGSAAEPEPVVSVPEPEPVVAAAEPEPVVAVPEPEPVVAVPEPEPAVAAAEPEPAAAEASEELTETRQRPIAVDVHEPAPAEEPSPDQGEETHVEVAPVAAPGEAGGATTSLAGLYREDDDRTQVLETAGLTAEEDAEERLAEQRRLEKEARDQRLGLVATSDANEVRDMAPPARPGVNGFASFGLLIFRLVVAGILGVAAMQILTPVSATADFLSQTRIPYPTEVAWGLGIALALMSVLLVLGLGVRVVGLVLTAICGASLAFLRWGPFPIFVNGQEGFIGDKDLLLAAVGILLFCIGGGKVGIDGAISKARWQAKLAKRS